MRLKVFKVSLSLCLCPSLSLWALLQVPHAPAPGSFTFHPASVLWGGVRGEPLAPWPNAASLPPLYKHTLEARCATWTHIEKLYVKRERARAQERGREWNCIRKRASETHYSHLKIFTAHRHQTSEDNFFHLFLRLPYDHLLISVHLKSLYRAFL